ncbi:hypothetical protein CBL_13801 [Carabus blaptoides fortunei]
MSEKKSFESPFMVATAENKKETCTERNNLNSACWLTGCRQVAPNRKETLRCTGRSGAVFQALIARRQDQTEQKKRNTSVVCLSVSDKAAFGLLTYFFLFLEVTSSSFTVDRPTSLFDTGLRMLAGHAGDSDAGGSEGKVWKTRYARGEPPDT